MDYAKEKSEHYLKKNNIMENDEQHLLDVPLIFSEGTPGYKGKEVVIALLYVLAGLGILISLILLAVGFLGGDNGISTTGIIILLISLSFIYLGRRKAKAIHSRVHFFVTNKKIYLTYDVKSQSYEHLIIDELEVAEIQKQTTENIEVTTRFLEETERLVGTDDTYFLYFRSRKNKIIEVEVSEKFAMSGELYNIFARPELIENILLPVKTKVTYKDKTRRNDNYDNDYDNDYDNYDNDNYEEDEYRD